MSYRSQSPRSYERRDVYRRDGTYERDYTSRRDYRGGGGGEYRREGYDRRDYRGGDYRREGYDNRRDYDRRDDYYRRDDYRRDDYKRRDDYRDNRYRRSPPRYERSRYRTYGDRSDREIYKDTGCLFVGNIPFHYREKDIEELFSTVGPIANVTIGEDKKTGMSKGHAFVQFQKPEDSIKANEKFNNYQIENRPLRIDWDEGLQYKREHYNPGAGAAGVRARYKPYDSRYHDRSPPRSPGGGPTWNEDPRDERETDRRGGSPTAISPRASPRQVAWNSNNEGGHQFPHEHPESTDV